VSPDGKAEKTLASATYSAWTFDGNGKRICGLRRGDGRLWEFWYTDITSGESRKLVTLDTPWDKTLVNPSLHPDGKRFLATVETDKSDIWTIEGITGK
jgi:hypothetical protein